MTRGRKRNGRPGCPILTESLPGNPSVLQTFCSARAFSHGLCYHTGRSPLSPHTAAPLFFSSHGLSRGAGAGAGHGPAPGATAAAGGAGHDGTCCRRLRGRPPAAAAGRRGCELQLPACTALRPASARRGALEGPPRLAAAAVAFHAGS